MIYVSGAFMFRDADGDFNPRDTLWEVDGADLAPQDDGRGIILTHSDGVQKALLKRDGGNFSITVYGTDAQALYKNAKIEVTQLGGSDSASYAQVQNGLDEVCHRIGADGSLWHGKNCLADSESSHAEGVDCYAWGEGSHAEGILASAEVNGERAWASGAFSVAGDAQGRNVVLRGSIEGGGHSEEVELKAGPDGDEVPRIQAPSAIQFFLEVLATDGADHFSFRQMVFGEVHIGPLFRTIFTIVGAVVAEHLSTEGARTWRVRLRPISFPIHQTRPGVVFSSGVSTTTIRVVCNLRMVEVTAP